MLNSSSIDFYGMSEHLRVYSW